MASTILIKKSKALNFKKLTFLYLVFIVFFFLSTSGDFVHHFTGLNRTQQSLNQKLYLHFKEYDAKLPDERRLKENAEKALENINLLNNQFQQFAKEENLKGEKLKELKFFRQILSKPSNYSPLNASLADFILCFPTNYQENLVQELGIEPTQLQLNPYQKNKLFLELPNAAVPSIFEQLKTILLSESLKYLKWEILEGGMLKISSARDSALLSGYKNTYYIGEKIDFDFFSRDSIPPTITLNQMSITPAYKGRHFEVSWTPMHEGTYELEAHIGDEFIKQSLKVIKPTLKFLETEQEIAAYLSETLQLTLDLNGLQGIKDLNFYSASAQLEQKGNALYITPLYEGRFTIEMRSGNSVMDTRTLLALKGKPPGVALKNIAGEISVFDNAHCLESTNPNWQVIHFKMTAIQPSGESVSYKSETRYLRNELRTIVKKLPRGSTILFQDIHLLNKNGSSTCLGNPIFFSN